MDVRDIPPLYLADVFHLNIKEVAFSAWVPYVGAALGSIAGGWYSGWLINRGHTVNYARKAAMLLGGIIIIPSILAAIMSTTAPVAIVFMALVLGGFQFFMTNLQTIPSDLHSGKSVGSLAGLGGASAVLGTILAILLPVILRIGYYYSVCWELWCRYRCVPSS